MAEIHVVILAVEATELPVSESVRGSDVVVNPHDPPGVESFHVLGGSVQLTQIPEVIRAPCRAKKGEKKKGRKRKTLMQQSSMTIVEESNDILMNLSRYLKK